MKRSLKHWNRKLTWSQFCKAAYGYFSSTLVPVTSVETKVIAQSLCAPLKVKCLPCANRPLQIKNKNFKSTMYYIPRFEDFCMYQVQSQIFDSGHFGFHEEEICLRRKNFEHWCIDQYSWNFRQSFDCFCRGHYQLARLYLWTE